MFTVKELTTADPTIGVDELLDSPFIKFSMKGWKYYCTWNNKDSVSPRITEFMLHHDPSIAEHWRITHAELEGEEISVVCRGKKVNFKGALDFWRKATNYNSIVRDDLSLSSSSQLLCFSVVVEFDDPESEVQDKFGKLIRNYFLDEPRRLISYLIVWQGWDSLAVLHETEDEFLAYLWHLYV